MAQPSEWVRRSGLLAQVVVAGTVALLALLIAVPLVAVLVLVARRRAYRAVARWHIRTRVRVKLVLAGAS
jgi:hypothetical protein